MRLVVCLLQRRPDLPIDLSRADPDTADKLPRKRLLHEKFCLFVLFRLFALFAVSPISGVDGRPVEFVQ